MTTTCHRDHSPTADGAQICGGIDVTEDEKGNEKRATCDKPVRDGFMCHEHAAQLRRNLILAAEVVPALAQVAAYGRGGGIPEFTVNRGWVAENKPLPLNMSAVVAVRHCYDTGADICGLLVAGFRPPAVEQRKIVGLLGYAAEHVGMLRLQPDVTGIYDDVLDVLKEAGKVLNRRDEVRQSKAATDERNEGAFDRPMLLADALLWLKVYRGEDIPKRTAMDWINDKDIDVPERRDEKGRHLAIPSTLLEEFRRPKRGRRTTAA